MFQKGSERSDVQDKLKGEKMAEEKPHNFNRNLRKVVETDSFGGDYPDEKFLNIPLCNEEKAIRVANAMNELFCDPGANRYWKVVPYNYVLQPGFEP